MPQTTSKIVKEQATIETLGDIAKRDAKNWTEKNKRYMKSISDLPFNRWRTLVLRKARKDLSIEGAGMLKTIVDSSYELNKLDDIGARNLNKKDSRTEAKNTKTTGKTPEQNIKHLLSTALGILSSESTRYNSQGLSNDQITNAIMGSKVEQYKNGDMIRYINGSRTVSTTNTKSAVESIRQTRYEKDDGVTGYVWVSVLDGVTSTTCMGLNAKEFYFTRNGKALSGYKPLPPIHPNCRSSTLPIKNGEVPEVESFQDWLKNNPEEVKEALGPTQFGLLNKVNPKTGRLSKDGLNIERFTDAKFKPMNIPQVVNQMGAPSASGKLIRDQITKIRADKSLTVIEQVTLINKLTE